MDNLINFIKTISAFSIISAALYLLILKDKMEKSLKFVLGLTAVCILTNGIITFFGGAEKIMISVNKTDNYSAQKNLVSNEITLEYAIGELLKQNNIAYKKLEITMDISEENSINITKAYIEPERTEDFEKAYNLVLKETGITLTGE